MVLTAFVFVSVSALDLGFYSETVGMSLNYWNIV